MPAADEGAAAVLMQSRAALQDALKAQHLLGVLIVLIFVVAVAAAIAMAAAGSMWYAMTKIEDLEAELVALEADQKAEWDDWKRIQERDVRIVDARIDDVELKMEALNVRSEMHN